MEECVIILLPTVIISSVKAQDFKHKTKVIEGDSLYSILYILYNYIIIYTLYSI